MSRGTAGLTLIEVLISILLLGVVSTATMTPLLSSMRYNGDNRIKAQAVIAGEAWLDRFRSKTLSFSDFNTLKTFSYDKDYSNDTRFVNANDTGDAADINNEWKKYKFEVKTDLYLRPVTNASDPVVWLVTVKTFYKRAGGEENFTLSSLIRQ